MDTLKMKFKLYNLEFELEGNENTVKEEFTKFKESFLNDLLGKMNIIERQVTTIPQGQIRKIEIPQSTLQVEQNDYPAIKEVVKKDLPKTEPEWVLIYAFYSSAFGENTFTEADLKKYYNSTGRKNVSRTGHFAHNVSSLLKHNYIKVHNDTEYLMKDEGINYAKQILSGNSTSKSVNRISTKSKNPSTVIESSEEQKPKKVKAQSSVGFVDLKLPQSDLKNWSDFFESKQPKGQNESVAVAMKWHKDYSNSSETSLEEINYLLSIVAKTPSALAQVLINMGGSQFRWVTKGSRGKYQLSSIGENYVMNKLPKS
jgi:hypothetical protein